MKKNQVYKSHKATLCIWRSRVIFFGVPELKKFGVRRLAGPQLPHRQLSAHMDVLHHTHAQHHIDAHYQALILPF